MADTSSAQPAAPVVTPKKSKAAAKPKTKKTVPSHPKTSDMVNAAIANLKERGGSSLQAIKKYIASNYKVDVEKLAPFIRKYLKSAVTNGTLVQKKGKGASGSFGLNPNQKTEKKAKKPAAKKAATGEKKTKKPVKKAAGEKKTKPSAAKKAKKSPAKPKKAPVAKKAAKPKKPKTPKKAKSPKKPKSPKPKKAPAAKKAKKN